MYCEFIFILIDYFSTINKRIIVFEWGIPLIIGCLTWYFTICSDNEAILYESLSNISSFLTTLLGFSIAALTLFITGNVEKTKKYSTNISIRGKNISLYRLTVISFSYLIIIESLLCFCYYVSISLNVTLDKYTATLVNCMFITFTCNTLLTTIRTITDLYLIISKE